MLPENLRPPRSEYGNQSLQIGFHGLSSLLIFLISHSMGAPMSACSFCPHFSSRLLKRLCLDPENRILSFGRPWWIPNEM